MLWDVVGVCAVVFQQTEDMLRVFKAYCTFKWEILQCLVRESKTLILHRQDTLRLHTLLVSYTWNQTHINTHINPFYPFSKLQSFVERVDVDSVR